MNLNSMPELTMETATKRCSGCNIDKQREEFSKRKLASDGYMSYCKACGVGISI